jgi:hypothetical protein
LVGESIQGRARASVLNVSSSIVMLGVDIDESLVVGCARCEQPSHEVEEA